MKRSRLRKTTKNYNIKRNFCKKLLRTTKKEYFNNLDIKKVIDNKTFWRTIIPTFPNKNLKNDKTILNEEDKTVSDEKELCRTFSTYFANIVSDVQLELLAINTFQNHPSVVNIKLREFNSTFGFQNTNENEVRKFIKNLNVRKSCQGTKIIKLNIDLLNSFICKNFN